MTVVFTNGCFDLLHRGHKHFLWEASRLGDRLIVGLNSDASVRRLKGPGRPVLKESERKEILLSLPWVSLVVIFQQDTPTALIRGVRPDVLAKSEEYAPGGKPCPEAAIVEGLGGRVVYLPRIPGISTTEILLRELAR